MKIPTPVVALGASAGGLEALQAFFTAMPPDAGMAFVLVVHLDPTHTSLLPELIQKKTAMEVCAVEDGMRLEAGRVFVIPPNWDLSISGGVLHLNEPFRTRGARLPIDTFLRALAADQGPNAACIIFSGTGTDGVLGIKAIKGEAGLVMVQSEESARFVGMPRSAIATGLVDYVLPPEEMPSKLVAYMARAARTGPRSSRSVDVEPGGALRTILLRVRVKTGHDFSEYKLGTVLRRIQRRMHVHQIDRLEDYAEFLGSSDREIRLLFGELMIGVTSFFRDPPVWNILGKDVIPELVKRTPVNRAVRVWVPGCSTGEEAYTLAILFEEYMEDVGPRREVQIFATDLNEQAVIQARTGRFPDGIASDVEEKRLRRFFRREEAGGFQISRGIRDKVIFAPQDLAKDPPFSGVDLISCRNLFIYMAAGLQERLIALFQYALASGGVLILGPSESLGPEDAYFTALDRKWKIFRRLPAERGSRRPPIFRLRPVAPESPPLSVEAHSRPEEKTDSMHLLKAILQKSGTPPCVVVDRDDRVVFTHGRTGPYLELPSGEPDLHLLKMVRRGLKTAMRSALRAAAEQKKKVVATGLKVRHEGGSAQLDLAVSPILDPGSLRGYMMVAFHEVADPDVSKRKGGAEGEPEGRTEEELKRELRETAEDLQSTLEDLETSNEELRSANEELQSANEELQSTNEELETSKEELQSLHEEAETVNAELQSRIEDLAAANDDLKNLLDSTQIATVFLDVDLCVRRFTPTATQILPLNDSDVGRPIKDLAAHLVDVDLARHAAEVLDKLTLQEAEVRSVDDHPYVMRVSPYRTTANVIDGVVLTFQEQTP